MAYPVRRQTSATPGHFSFLQNAFLPEARPRCPGPTMAESERGDRSVDPGSAPCAYPEENRRSGESRAVAAPLSRRAAGTAGPGTPMAGGCAGGPQKTCPRPDGPAHTPRRPVTTRGPDRSVRGCRDCGACSSGGVDRRPARHGYREVRRHV